MTLERLDIFETIAVLQRTEKLLRGLVYIGTEELKTAHKDVKTELNRLKALYGQVGLGPRERFVSEHPPVLDTQDGIYDCGNPKCPASGFKNKEDKDLHHKMWGNLVKG